MYNKNYNKRPSKENDDKIRKSTRFKVANVKKKNNYKAVEATKVIGKNDQDNMTPGVDDSNHGNELGQSKENPEELSNEIKISATHLNRQNMHSKRDKGAATKACLTNYIGKAKKVNVWNLLYNTHWSSNITARNRNKYTMQE